MNKAKSQEKLVISTGSVLCIDQFMLANQQCLQAIGSGEDLPAIVGRYGGAVFSFPNGEYQVFRDAKLQLVAIAKEESSVSEDEEGLGSVIESFGPDASSQFTVNIDTRCLVISDSSVLSNTELLSKFSTLRKEEKEKEARDLLRESGAAVRYGFNKWGDQLSLFTREEPDALAALWAE